MPQLSIRGLVVAAAFLGLSVLAGCADPGGPAVPNVARVSVKSPDALLAPAHTPRGIEDKILEVERALPGTGGLFVDPNGDVVVYLTDLSRAPAIGPVLTRVFGADSPLMGRPDGSPARVTARQGTFSFSSLVSWKEGLHGPAFQLPGVRILDADEARNRVRIVVADSATEAAVSRIADALGIPREAIMIETRQGHFAALATLSDRQRPTKAGFKITTGVLDCTMGFAVTDTTGAKYFATAAHCTANYTGPTGVHFYQPTASSPYHVGQEAQNPAWSTTGCAVGADYCNTIDVALIQFDDSITYNKSVVVTTSQGTGNSSGNTTVGSTYVVGATTDAPSGRTVYKTGITTGTTYGPVVGTCVDLPSFGSPAHSLSCQYEVQARADPGDSGSPVFYWGVPLVTSARYATGILHTVDIPLAGGTYYYYYSTWSAIQNVFGSVWPF